MENVQVINYQIVVNTGNYESIRLGVEFTPDARPISQQFVDADAQLRQTANAIVEARKGGGAQATSSAEAAKGAQGITATPSEDSESKGKEATDAQRKTAATGAKKRDPKIEAELAKAKEAEAAKTPAPTDKTPLPFDSPILQKVLKRMEKGGVSVEKVLEFYAPDAQALAAIQLCAKMNN